MLISARGASFLMAAMLLATATWAPAAEPMTRLTGTVVDPQGKLLAGASVWLAPSDSVEELLEVQPQFVLTTRTDLAGQYRFSLPRALREVTVVAHGRGWSGAKLPAKLDVAERTLPALRLSAGVTVTGRVVDTAGRPLLGAVITDTGFIDWETRSDAQPQVTTKSGSDGRFVLAGVDVAINHLLCVEMTGYVGWCSRGYAPLDKDPKRRNVDITLEPGKLFSGVVTNPSGQPLRGARVIGAGTQLLAITDAAGHFRFGPVDPAGGRFIGVELAGHAPLSAKLEPNTDAPLVLQPNGTLRGRIVDAASNAPIKQFKIVFRSLGQFFAPRRVRNVASADGRFVLPDEYSGVWTITVLAPGYAPLDVQDLAIPPTGETSEVLIALQRGAVVRGRVIDRVSGQPLPGVSISYASEPDSVTTDAQGTFTLSDLRRGTLEIHARARGYATTTRAIAVEEEQFVELTLGRGARVTGQLVAADGVTPKRGTATITIGGFSWESATDRQGRFELPGDQPGRYQIKGSTATERTDVKEVTLTQDQWLDGIKLVLRPAASIRGTLVGLSPSELSQVQVFAALSEWPPDSLSSPFTFGEDRATMDAGHYRIDGREPGSGTVVARFPSGEVRRRIEVPESGEVVVDFDFTGGQPVTGRVTHRGQPVKAAEIRAVSLDSQDLWAMALTSASGEYSFTGLPAGRYRIGPLGATGVLVSVSGSVVQEFVLSD